MYEKVSGDFRDWLLDHGLSPKKTFLEEAPLLVVVLMDRSAPYARESVWVAVGFILLALEETGLSTLPYTPSNMRYPLEELDVPPEYALEVILPIGYSEDQKQKEPKRALEEIVHRNRWGDSLAYPRPQPKSNGK
ncbi:nitroreductase [Thaumarchaeota archaeon SCGC AB-539-E09]|nr:nitroreductase [Thaumarchaeota archaeon SCGC AB-539-E09]